MKPGLDLIMVLLVTINVHSTYSYPDGAPEQACSKLDPSPGHGKSTSDGLPPFKLTFSTTSYKENSKINVTLEGINGTKFKGFLVVARKADGKSQEPIGVLQQIPGISIAKQVCSGSAGNGVTHTTSEIKSSVSLEWTAPSSQQGDLIFHFTVVRSGAPSSSPTLSDYFRDIKSELITGPPGPPGPPTPPPGKFQQDPGCGSTKACYSNCEQQLCDIEASWEEQGSHYRIVLRSMAKGDKSYVALGFSTSGGMSKSSVVSCVTFNGTTQVVASTNVDYANVPLAKPGEGISGANVTYNNGLLECSFLRETTSDNPLIYNLTTEYSPIIARGQSVSATVLKYHDERHIYSDLIFPANKSTNINFAGKLTTTPPPQSKTTNNPKVGKFPKDPDCGKTKGCYSDCYSDGCVFLSSWKQQGSHFRITLKKSFASSNNHWVALGFADKKGKMAPASVVECLVHNDKILVSSSFNPGLYNELLQPSNTGLSNLTGSYTNGILECSFLRETKSSTNNEKFYDLENSYYVITASGVVSQNGELQPHNALDAFCSGSRVNPADKTVDINIGSVNLWKVQVHGILMVVAWMICSGIALPVARFYKTMWPDSTLCGVKVWFSFHRTLMYLAFFCGILGIVFIFVEVQGWSQIIGDNFQKSHPILGVIVTSCLLINPIMAFFRPGADNPKRILFNYAHWFVGASSSIIAAVTIYAGLTLSKARVDNDIAGIMTLINASWHVGFFTIQSILDCCSKTKDSKNTNIQTRPNTIQPLPQPLPGSQSVQWSFSADTNDLIGNAVGESSNSLNNTQESKSSIPSLKKYLLILHVMVVLGISSYLIYLIIDADN